MELHPECADAAHPCFGCKMKVWKRRGAPISRKRGEALGPSGESFWNTTVREEQAKIVADAKRGGADPAPVGTRWV